MAAACRTRFAPGGCQAGNRGRARAVTRTSPTWRTNCANVLGPKFILRYAQGKGALEIAFFSDAELERILQILGVNPD